MFDEFFKKPFVDFAVYWLLLSQFIVVIITFLMAYAYPTKSITIYINRYGEANVEFILMVFLGVLFVLILIYKFKMWKGR